MKPWQLKNLRETLKLITRIEFKSAKERWEQKGFFKKTDYQKSGQASQRSRLALAKGISEKGALPKVCKEPEKCTKEKLPN